MAASLMDSSSREALLKLVLFGDDGLVPVIVQSAEDRMVLMMAYMNRMTLEQTLKTGLMTYWSRSREEIWVKGETSGSYQHVRAVHVDCDGDALLFVVDQKGGGACHTGNRTCFYRSWDVDAAAETSE